MQIKPCGQTHKIGILMLNSPLIMVSFSLCHNDVCFIIVEKQLAPPNKTWTTQGRYLW